MISLTRSNVAGSYQGIRQGAKLELRVDVGNDGSLDVISGDLHFEAAPGQFEFHHSFQTTALIMEDQTSSQLLRGPVKVHRENMVHIGRLDLTIPTNGDLIAIYSLYRLTNSGRETVAELTFSLQLRSPFFRGIDLEMESVAGVPFPRLFNTSDHSDTPPEARDQTLSLRSVYATAGIELNVIAGGEEIPVSAAGFDGLWTDEELHAAMVAHFDEHRDSPQWRMYLLLATRYVQTGVLGIMFDAADDDEFHRQGAAVFHDHPAIGSVSGSEKDREYLFTIVHELGHAFNFLHSFQKGIIETHGVLPRPDAMSWMNYPQLFPFGYAGPAGWDGTDQFWSRFGFTFDREEVHHLRHNDHLEVVPGGASFGFAGHFEERPFSRPTRDLSYNLTLWVPAAVEFLQQIEGDVRLQNNGVESIIIPPSLDLAAGHLELLVKRTGQSHPRVYQRFNNICVRDSSIELGPSEAVYQEISPSYGRRKWFVDEPGTYELQASLSMPDGRKIHSNVQKTRVSLAQ